MITDITTKYFRNVQMCKNTDETKIVDSFILNS
jgi:hypothetical protein